MICYKIHILVGLQKYGFKIGGNDLGSVAYFTDKEKQNKSDILILAETMQRPEVGTLEL